MKVILVVLVLLILPFNSLIAQQAQPDPAVASAGTNIDKLMRNAIAGKAISGKDIEAFLHRISTPASQESDYKRWIPRLDEIGDLDTKSRAVILLAMGLYSKGNEMQSVELTRRYENKIQKTYMDQLPAVRDAPVEELLSDYFGWLYGWLINNTEFSVPRAFVENYPDIFFNHTPVWGATRDAYFQVTLPEDAREWLDVFAEWQSLLSDAMNPAGVHLGSMFNLVHKVNLQTIALIEYRPELYSSYVTTSNRANWLDSWQFLGIYEKELKSEIDEVENQLKRLLVERLVERHYLQPEDANLIVEIFTHQIQNSFFGVANSRYAKDTEILMKEVSSSGWPAAIQSVYRFHPKAAEFQLQIIGGYLISKGEFQQLEHYINWLAGKEFDLFLEKLSEQTDGYSEYFVDDETGQSIAATLTGNLAAQDSHGLGTIIEWIKFDYDQWGSFNKTPAMYAAHHNNLVSYKTLRNARPELLVSTTVEGEYGVPEIFGRNVLTYALENADSDFISQVLNDVGKLFVPKVDSAGRNAFFYLGLNKLVNSRERTAFVGRIQDLGLPLPEASFDCKLAQRRIELLTCGSESFAALDRELPATYFAARRQAEDSNALLKEQRDWLSNALVCITERSFESCYSARISDLSDRIN